MFGSGVRKARGESGGFLKESVILCPANRQPGGIHERRVRRARADIVLLEVRQALSRPVWRDQGVSRGNLSTLPRGEQDRCVRVPSADEADAAVDTRRERLNVLLPRTHSTIDVRHKSRVIACGKLARRRNREDGDGGGYIHSGSSLTWLPKRLRIDAVPVNFAAARFNDVTCSLWARTSFFIAIALRNALANTKQLGCCLVADLGDVFAEFHAHGLWAFQTRLSTSFCGC